MNNATEMWLRYTHLDKLYGYLPGISDALPTIFGLTPDQYAEITARFDTRARATATDLLVDEDVATTIDALPFRPGQTVLAVGDSVTDDAQSWAEILRHLLHIRRPAVHPSTDSQAAITRALAEHLTTVSASTGPGRAT